MNKSSDFLGLRTESKEDETLVFQYAIHGEACSLKQWLLSLEKLIEGKDVVIAKLRYEIENCDKLKGRLEQAERRNEQLLCENRAMVSAVARTAAQRKRAERETNRLQHNVYKFIAAKLAELEDVDYTSLEEVDKHYWREFAALEMKWFMG
jgi:hypothetical protein